MDDIKTLGIDIETYSSIDLVGSGVHRYVEADDFTILLFAYSVNYGPVKCIDFANGEELPEEIYNALWEPSVEKTAYNAPFERTCIGKFYGKYCDPKQWSCTMVLALTCGLPGSLKQVGEALGLGEDKAKMSEGAALIRYFCVPCRPTKSNGGRTRNLPEDAPDKWAVFKAYNIRDVEVETTIRTQLLKWRPDRREQRFWELDQQINDRGIKVDVQLAEKAIAIGNKYKEELLDQAKQISGLENPNSTAQIKQWLEEQEDVEVLSLNKKAVVDIVANLQGDDTKAFMSLREEFSKSSTKKYDSVLRCVCDDDHVHGLMQFYGAGRTGRFAGRLIQVQNLPQNHMSDLDTARAIVKAGDYDTFTCLYEKPQSTLSELIRTTIIPEEGHRFIVCDYSAIEARVVAWIAGEEWRLDTFRNNGDIYCASASQAFKVPVVKHGINGHLRQKGKVLELACIAEGQLVLTDLGLVPIEDVTTANKVWDGCEWVEHEGVVYRGEKDVIEYEGLTATTDHLVFIEGESEPVEFGVAASCGAHLVQTGVRQEKELARYKGKARVYDIRNAGRHHRFTVSGRLVHNCGYGGGVGAMKNFGADKMGMSEEEMAQTVDLWREASPKIVALWKSLDKAAMRCITTGKTTETEVGHIRFTMEDGVMWMRLPSGRRIAYWGACVGKDKWDRKSIAYMGLDQKTHKWTQLETFGGKLTENLVQATARDVLREAMFALDKHGYDVRATVHDEVIITVPNGTGSIDEVRSLMSQGAEWTEGLPLNAEGYECESYRKD